jgi:hypothetical protein
MDAEALKIILDLKEENTLLKRAMLDAIIALRSRKEHPMPEYGISDVSFLFSEIKDILSDYEINTPLQDSNRENIKSEPISVKIAL